MSTMYYTQLQSPVGDFLVAGTESAIHFTAFSTGNQQRPPGPEWHKDGAPIQYAIDPLRAYFDGEVVDFDIPLALNGSAFQCDVWRALQSVPYGQTASYGDIAQRVGRPAASRAVGARRLPCL